MSTLKNPASDLATALTTQTLGSVTLTLGTNLFVGHIRPDDTVTSRCVFCLNTGGPAPAPYLNGNRESFYRPTVQVLIRSSTADIQGGETLARAVFEYLHLKTQSGYVGIFARDSQPAPLGTDASQRYLWVINFECQYRD